MIPRTYVPDYFTSPRTYLWKFDESCEAIVWGDTDVTILMLAHLQKLCRPLAVQLNGLPSLTALLFIVDALNKGWSSEEACSRLKTLIGLSNLPDDLSLLQQVSDWLASLQHVDAEYRVGFRGQLALLSELFEELPESMLEAQHDQAVMALQWLDQKVGDFGSLQPLNFEMNRLAAANALKTLDLLSLQCLDPSRCVCACAPGWITCRSQRRWSH